MHPSPFQDLIIHGEHLFRTGYVHEALQVFESVMTRLGVKTSALLARKSVEVATDAFDGLGNFLRRPAARALKEHVLDEMRNAIEFGWFVAATHADPNAQTHAGHVRNFRRGDS